MGTQVTFIPSWREAPAIIVPASRQFVDYEVSVSQIVDILSKVEDRDDRSVLRDLSSANDDLIRVKLPEASDSGSVPIEQGVALFQHCRDLMLSAACSAWRPQRAYRAGGVRDANDYLRTVRLGQTEPGSYVINIISPVPPNLSVQRHLLDDVREPFARRATRSLVSGLEATRQALSLASSDGDYSPFEEGVARGVSANFCDALADMLDKVYGQSLEISVNWALTRKAPREPMSETFRHADAMILSESSRVLRDRQERSNEQIEGYVTRLARERNATQGEVTIKAMVDDSPSPRSVRVHFGPSLYSRIAAAHDNRDTVSLEGGFTKRGPTMVPRQPPKSERHT